jgi:ElaB/YqjD/DUF883 family membrane-anchored ribosome-binding protein
MTATQSSSGAHGAKEQVQEKAQEAAGEARSRLRDQVDQRSTQAGDQVSSSAEALRSTAEKLREEGREGPARAAEQLATQAEKVGSYLSGADADKILDDVEQFARRQPLAVVGIGLFAGFAASRFLKASSRTRYESRSGGSVGSGSAGGEYPPRITSPAARSGGHGSGIDAGSGLTHGGGARPGEVQGATQEPPSVPSGIR